MTPEKPAAGARVARDDFARDVHAPPPSPLACASTLHPQRRGRSANVEAHVHVTPRDPNVTPCDRSAHEEVHVHVTACDPM